MTAKIPIVGIGPDGLDGLSGRSRELLAATELVFGSEAVLRQLPELAAERVRIGTDLPDTVDRLRRAANEGRKVAIVATGDPLFYGTARYLCDKLGPDLFDVIPHVSSMQLAFAKLKESCTSETVGLFPSDTYPPNRVARELLARGIDYFRVSVCENLGGKDERITQGELNDVQDLRFDRLSVMVLRRKPNRPDAPRNVNRLARFGNPDDVFAQSRPKTGLITQAEVRAVALAQMDLHPGDVAWDVGAGSGSVAIEMAQLTSPGTVYAIEQDSVDYHLIVANAEKFGTQNLKPIFGTAPAIFAELPPPDAIFVGGNGGEVARLLEASYAALRPGGRLVSNVGTLEMISSTYAVLKRLAGVGGVEVLLMNLARGVEQLESLRFEAINPTVLLKATKPHDTTLPRTRGE